MSDLARITIEDGEELRVAAVVGEVDASNADDVRSALVAELPNSALGLMADLRELTYLDSSGIAVLFELADRLTKRGQVLALVLEPGSMIRPTMELTGVGSVAVLSESREDAADRIRAGRA